MRILKVRRVGNSNVVSTPREYEAKGFTPGSSVLLDELPDGELRLLHRQAARADSRHRSSRGRRASRGAPDPGRARPGRQDARPVAALPDPAAVEPIYLLVEDLLELYAAIIGATAAQAADQLRNRKGLEGALARPATHAH